MFNNMNKSELEFIYWDRPGELIFSGSSEAELFTREIKESFEGVLSKNFNKDIKDGMAGFVSASVDGRPWTGTMWTRDAGVFLRELVAWGYYGHAALLVHNLITLVQQNEEGFYAFPERFEYGTKAYGKELDGTSAIIIGMILLWESLEDGNPVKYEIQEFLSQPASPVRYMIKSLEESMFVPGSGEFGAGCGIEGLFFNAVQNHMVRLALLAAGRMERKSGNHKTADMYVQTADKLLTNILKHFVNEDGVWIWCLDPATLKADFDIINASVNKGFGGINGILTMQADVLGFDPSLWEWNCTEVCLKTFYKLLDTPLRKEQFKKYGIWTQFDEIYEGMLSSPSYGHGYALQAMLLLDKPELANKALKYLAETTFDPPEKYKLDRESIYHFYERFYSSDAVGRFELDQGCGALNLVNVAEPLKVARLIAGIDTHQDVALRIIPKLPLSIKGYQAKNWPIKIGDQHFRIDVNYERNGGSSRFELDVRSMGRISKVCLQLNGANYAFQDVTRIEMIIPDEERNSERI